MIRILICGCGGYMGRVLADLSSAAEDIEVAAGVDPVTEGKTFSFPVFANLSDCHVAVDVIVDFSNPKALRTLIDGALQRSVPLVIATTGHSQEDREYLMSAAASIPILQAANMSIGINLLADLLQKTAAVLGNQFDIEIIEKHHNRKLDAPSGTAYELAKSINKAFMNEKTYVFDRHTRTERRTADEIGIHAVRGGTIVGEHQVMFAGTDEVLELKHTAFSRQVFAAGALRAVRFISDKAPGCYSMKDMVAKESSVTSMYASDEEALVSLHDLPYEPSEITQIFKSIGDRKINLDMISQTTPVEGTVDISFTLPRKDIDQAMALLKACQDRFPQLRLGVVSDITKITVTGPGMEVQSGVAAQVFEAMTSRGIALEAVTTSETKISYVISQQHRQEAIEGIKATFGI
ncbi:MAG: 4-hydroxy-tetrahydrodipicolinate reductase [Desulfofustis sp.]|nr:4-hydroxy-tetrahydrodipicolinate reductase [Desulfofustis sp.]